MITRDLIETEARALYETFRMGAGTKGKRWPRFDGIHAEAKAAWRASAKASLERRVEAVALAIIDRPALGAVAAKLGARLAGGDG